MTRTIISLFFCTLAAAAQTQIVFRGIPAVRVFSSADRDDREKLNADEAQKAECVIVQRGRNKYFWHSRNDVPMLRVDTPQFTYFLHSGGSGYVKVYTGERAANKESAEYVESFTRGLEITTYWGRVQNPVE